MRKTIFLGAFIVLGCLSIQSRATDQAPDAKQEFLKALQNSKSAKIKCWRISKNCFNGDSCPGNDKTITFDRNNAIKNIGRLTVKKMKGPNNQDRFKVERKNRLSKADYYECNQNLAPLDKVTDYLGK
jgi:hypothetical protein